MGAMSDKVFLRPRLQGKRFEDGSIPLDILGDLVALQEMILEVARWRYLQANRDRHRSPRWFHKTELKITSINKGSAMPIIKISSSQPPLDGEVPYKEFFDQARNDIVETIRSVENNNHQNINTCLPSKYLAYFNQIGRNLRNDECIDLCNPEDSTPAKLTHETRNNLLRRSSVSELMQKVMLRGTVPTVDQDRMTFGLKLHHGLTITSLIPDQYKEIILDTFNNYKKNTKLLVSCVGRYNRNDKLSGIAYIEHITTLDPLDISTQLDDVRDLKDGWFDGDGVAFNQDELDWLANMFERYYSDNAIFPHVYPVPENDVNLEWSIDTLEIGLEINLRSHKGVWSWDDVHTKDNDERELDLDKSENWDWIAKQIIKWSDKNR